MRGVLVGSARALGTRARTRFVPKFEQPATSETLSPAVPVNKSPAVATRAPENHAGKQSVIKPASPAEAPLPDPALRDIQLSKFEKR